MRKGGKNPSFSTLLKRAKETRENPLYSFRLYNCQAMVYHSEKYLVLRSYNTIVALYDIENETAYDFLRIVYGYTATSAQHIAKFIDKYIPSCYPFTIVKKVRIDKATDI